MAGGGLALDEQVEVDRACQRERGDGGDGADGDVVQWEPGVAGLLVEADRVEHVGPDAGDGGECDQRGHVEAGAQGAGVQDQERADAQGDEAVHEEGKDVGEGWVDVAGGGHLAQGVVGQCEGTERHEGDPGTDRQGQSGLRRGWGGGGRDGVRGQA